ncbi:leukocyte immunoglobulin-like receptor subfamily A member 6 isoform X1 [Ochotona princeps]|uniref:leukocyte immunoglobulin-like receptor subfamily A member 6 isoform X1 n=2 Tax=Ochotona princeps TaxID=9978 RepID=UPI00271535F8|nr:leukocyte immunoglobulin-like receptor subfamily A member 6 isoform X1 [Ochotona princeps]
MGAWPKPSISAEPGLTIPLGQNMTFVCRSPETFRLFRLVKEGIRVKDERSTSPDQTETRFPMGPVEASMAGRYHCVYLTSHGWSDHSEALELVVAPEEVTQASVPDPALPSVPTFWKHTVSNGIRLGLAGVVLLILAAILAEAWYSERKSQ